MTRLGAGERERLQLVAEAAFSNPFSAERDDFGLDRRTAKKYIVG